MSLIVNGVEIENVICNSVNIDTIIYNGVTVFESKDKLVLNVSSVSDSAGSDGVYVYITSGEKGCTATYNNETKTIPPNTQGEINFITETSGITGDLSIEGDFTMVEIPNIGEGGAESPGYIINQIKQWYKKINNIPEGFFYHQNIDFDINLPDNIIRIERLAFDMATISNSSLTFNNLEYCYTFGLRDTFFNNATNNGDVWSINGFALAPYGSNASSRTDTFTIPNGTKSMAASLFYYYDSGGGLSYFNLSNIIFPTDGLLTEIPDNFCTDAVNLTSIEFPSSITQIGSFAFGQANQTMTLNEITFNESENVIIEFPAVGSSTGAFYTKSAIETTVNAENVSVLNYDWSGDNRTVTFYKLDKTTIIPKLETPTITLNGNILTIDSYDSNSAEFEISAFNNIIQTSSTTIDLTQYIPEANQNMQTYEIKVRSLTNSINFAGSISASVTYTVATEGEE